ncbi:MAG: hypothetical protein KC466_20475 [Myxococcales bacterium]|nr:hypothetical protein [Myxococcales bacterium]
MADEDYKRRRDIMTMNLAIHGPIEVPFEVPNGRGVKHIDKDQKKAFLASLDDAGLASKQGCYIFAIRASRGYRPWYVGKATRSLRQECMQPGKLNHYNAALSKILKGTPVMFFVAPDGRKNKVSESVCEEMETFLIQSAYFMNPDIRNIQKKKVPEWKIRGVLRSGRGKPTVVEQAFRTMLGL